MQNTFKVGDKVRQKNPSAYSAEDYIHYEEYLGGNNYIVEAVNHGFVYTSVNGVYSGWRWERFELVPEEKVQEEVKSEEKIPILKEKFWWGIIGDENQILDLYKTRQNASESKIYWPDSTKIKKVKLTVME